MATVNPVGGSGTEEGRDGWCTPAWLARVIGRVDLDPCSNVRSHISAINEIFEVEDGLGGSHPWAPVPSHWRVFCNPPYVRGQVLRWVRHYRRTNFIFLLRWAPDTEWFRELWPVCWGAWFPNVRINFEPPPGVESSSNPFPHALYLRREPAGEFLDRLLASGYLVRNERRCDSVSVPASTSPTGGTGRGGASAGAVSTWEALRGPPPWPTTKSGFDAGKPPGGKDAGTEGCTDVRGTLRGSTTGEARRGEVGVGGGTRKGRVRVPRWKVSV